RCNFMLCRARRRIPLHPRVGVRLSGHCESEPFIEPPRGSVRTKRLQTDRNPAFAVLLENSPQDRGADPLPLGNWKKLYLSYIQLITFADNLQKANVDALAHDDLAPCRSEAPFKPTALGCFVPSPRRRYIFHERLTPDLPNERAVVLSTFSKADFLHRQNVLRIRV